MIQEEVLDLSPLQGVLRDTVLSQDDIRVMAGIERISLNAYWEPLTNELVFDDDRLSIKGSSSWTASHSPFFGLPGYAGTPAGNNPALPQVGLNFRVFTGRAGQQLTINWEGTDLVIYSTRWGGSGMYTVSTDGGASVQYDNWNNSAIDGIPRLIASGLNNGPHTTVITVSSSKNASATDMVVRIEGFDVVRGLDSTLAYKAGTAFIKVRPTSVLAGTLSLPTLGTASARRDLVILRAGAEAPEVIQGDPTSAGDSLATFLSKSEVAFHIGASDGTGVLGRVYSTNASTLDVNPKLIRLGGPGPAADDATGVDFQVIGFIGTGIEILFNGQSQRGIFAWSIDGGAETTVDAYSLVDTARTQVLAYNLPFGYHQLKVRKTGTKNASSSGYSILIGGYNVYHPKAPDVPSDAMALCEAVQYPSDAWIRHESTELGLQEGANWLLNTNEPLSMGTTWNNANTNTTDTLTFGFTGDKFRLRGNKGPAVGGWYDVLVDGVLTAQVTTYDPVQLFDAVQYTSGTLPHGGYHTVTVRTTNAKHSSATGYAINIDCIEVRPAIPYVKDLRETDPLGKDALISVLREHERKHHDKKRQNSSVSYSAVTTTSLTPVPVGDRAYMDCSGRPILLLFSGQVTNNTSTAVSSIKPHMDGVVLEVVDHADNDYATATANEYMPITTLAFVACPSPGLHDFGISVKVSGGTATYSGRLLVMEVGELPVNTTI
jgi:hypothetical protein